MSKQFYFVDVFTDRAFSGNPLAVFPEAEGLDPETMQKIAAEIGFSETVFVFPSAVGALRKLRIFTPTQELPLAGHPVIGAWTVLAGTGAVPVTEDGTTVVTQELIAGVLPVEIRFVRGRVAFVMMTQTNLRLGPPLLEEPFLQRLASALGLQRGDLAAGERMPVQTSNSGITSLDVPVASLDALSRIRIHPAELSELYGGAGAIGCHAFALETMDPRSRIHARFFAPDDRIPEDAATGSASGSLAGYLVHHGILPEGEFVIEQGDFMNRPSRISCRVSGTRGSIASIEVGGSAVVMAKGEFLLGAAPNSG